VVAVVLPRDVPVFGHSLVIGAACLQVFRIIEIVRMPAAFPALTRIVRMLLPHETRFMHRVPRELPIRELALALAFLVGAVALALAASWLAPPSTPYAAATPLAWLRWLAGGASVYAGVEGIARALCSITKSFGWEHEPVQRAPVASRSLAEFWGVRWNRIVGLWLRKNVFEPFARRRAPGIGVAASFVVSGVLHALLTSPIGVVPAVWIQGFFTAHGALTLVDVRLRSAMARRALAWATFVVTLPLFVEPALRCLGL
jgi:hypothetical protein